MKLLRVISSMNPSGGGPAQGIRYSIPVLGELGIENQVVCLDNPDEFDVSQDPCHIHAIGAGHRPLHYHPQLLPWLQQHIVHFDAVIIHGLWSFHSYAVTRVIRQLKKNGLRVPKVYVMPHGMLDPWFQRDKSRRLKALRNKIYWHLIESKTVNNADGLLFTCRQELTLAMETFEGYKPKRSLNVGYGVATPPTCHVDMRFPIKKPYWLFLSRIHPKKGVDLLLRAYTRLQQVHQNIPDLLIAGPGTGGNYGQSLLQLANNNGQIHFSGMLQGDAKWGALYGCEAFILPSHQENFGIAVVEALACGKPVLISNQVNIWREIKEGNAGIVTTDTEEGTFRALCTWLEMSVNEKQNMSAHAKEVYLNHFTIERAATKLKEALIAE